MEDLDLKAELTAYAEAGEPPVRLKFDEVLSAGRRSRRGQRAGLLGGVIAGVALVAGMIPVLLDVVEPNSPPEIGMAGIPALCKNVPVEAGARQICVFESLVTEGSEKYRTTRGAIPPAPEANDPNGGPYVGTPNGHGGHTVAIEVYDNKGGSTIEMDVRPVPSTPEACAAPTCKVHTGPRGEKVYARDRKEGNQLFRSVTMHSKGTRIEITATNAISSSSLKLEPGQADSPGGYRSGEGGPPVWLPDVPWTTQKLITIITTPELAP